MKVRKLVRFLVVIFFLECAFSAIQAKAQEKDAGLWTSLNFETKLVKKLSLSLSEEFRFNENITELGTSFTDIGLDYKLNKHWQVAVDYRFTQKRRLDDYYSFRHRFYADIKYNHKLNPFEISFRSRLQDEYDDIGRAPDGGVPIFYMRNKIGLKWDTKKKYEPYLSAELFSPLNYPREFAFDNIRTLAGVEYSISKHHSLDVFYMIQRELNVSSPKTDFIIGLGYYFKL